MENWFTFPKKYFKNQQHNLCQCNLEHMLYIMPMNYPVLGPSYPIDQHICLPIQLNEPTMADPYIFTINWFQYLSTQLMTVYFETYAVKNKLPRFSPVLFHRWRTGQNIWILIQLNVPQMEYSSIFPNNKFQQLNLPPMANSSAYPKKWCNWFSTYCITMDLEIYAVLK